MGCCESELLKSCSNSLPAPSAIAILMNDSSEILPLDSNCRITETLTPERDPRPSRVRLRLRRRTLGVICNCQSHLLVAEIGWQQSRRCRRSYADSERRIRRPRARLRCDRSGQAGNQVRTALDHLATVLSLSVRSVAASLVADAASVGSDASSIRHVRCPKLPTFSHWTLLRVKPVRVGSGTCLVS